MADRLGATSLGGDRTAFTVWAPAAERVDVVLRDDRVEPLAAGAAGYHRATLENVGPGARYRYRLHRADGQVVDRADPASAWQPDGLHGPSAVVARAFAWTDATWRNPPLRDHVLYELHVGTFTPQGTFDAVIPRLAELAELGVTALELLPVWQFPGSRNWGYDGVLQYAVQDSYGGPDGLRRLVDAAHGRGLAVVLDVVYNHLGPEGNHLGDFGPYFTDRYGTPWGAAVNLDDAGSDEVRRYLIDSAVRWVEDFHVDGFRLDAVHALYDTSAVHFLESLAAAVHAAADEAGRRVFLIAESDLQDPTLVRSSEAGGYGLEAQWLDDFHHSVHVAVTGEQGGYYDDYDGLRQLSWALRDRYALAGRWSEYRQRTVGRPARDVPFDRFVVCIQNHDQVGNRMLGERLGQLVGFEPRKLAAAVLLLSPYVPLLFMGEEYGETAPFQYFVSHTDPELVEAVRTGRREEFAAFAWQGEAPDPQSEATFHRSTLDWSLRDQGRHRTLLALYRELLALRRAHPAVAGTEARDPAPIWHAPDILSWSRSCPQEEVVVAVHAADQPGRLSRPVAPAAGGAGGWQVAIDTADAAWDGPGGGGLAVRDGMLHLDLAPHSVMLACRRGGE